MKSIQIVWSVISFTINMKDNIIALAIVLAIYSAVIWGIPYALGIEVLPYWRNAFDLLFIPILIYFIFRKDGLHSILKDTHQFNKEQIKQDEEELKRQFVD